MFFATDRNRDAAATTSTTMRNHGFAAEVCERGLVGAEMRAKYDTLGGALTRALFAVHPALTSTGDTH